MLIGYEASALQGCKSGVGYYAQNLLAAMMAVAPEHEYLLFSNRDLAAGWKALGNEQLYQKRYFPVRAAWMQGVLPGSLRRAKPDICHFPNYLAPVATNCPYVVTIHDMTLYITPRLHRWKTLLLDRILIPLVARRARAILTVSHSAKQDIVRFLNVRPSRVHVVMNAVSPAFRPVKDEVAVRSVRSRYGVSGPYILYVGTIEPRKNLTRLIAAFKSLKREGLPHRLVMVGQAGWHCEPIYAEVERQGLQGEVLFTGYVPFEDLPALYSGASVMAFPSLYEGFGLPVLEAMACGTPVVTSKSSGLSEVAGEAALLVDPLSVGDLARALRAVCLDAELARLLSARGLERAAHFTWENAARQTLAIYGRVVGSGQRAVMPGRQRTEP